MIHYTFDISEHDATTIQPGHMDGEKHEDFEARMRAAKGNNVFRILAICEGKQFGVWSPYFDKTSEQNKWSVFAKAMKEVKKIIIGRERMKSEQAKEPVKSSLLITDGVEEQMQQFRRRLRN